MYVVEILLPLYRNDKEPQPKALFAQVRGELVERFGGLTAFTRSPAEGLWEEGGEVARDEIVIFEVMTDAIDRDWWTRFRAALEHRFGQEEILIRARRTERL
jgi:hypothetical protein